VTAPFVARLSSIHSNHKRIAAGALFIASLALIAKVFAAAREMAIAWRYGVSGTVDAYQLALTVGTWVPMMLTSVISAVLVPRLIALERNTGDRLEFVAEFNGSVLIVGILVTGLTLLTAPTTAALLVSRNQLGALHVTSVMIAQMAPLALFVIFSGYFSARLQARERYSYSLTEAVPALTIAICVIAAIGFRGVGPLIFGTLLGFLLQGIVLCGMTQWADGGLGGFRITHRSREWRSFYHSIGVMVLGQAVLGLSIPIDQAFAARLGPGSVATLGYANRIVMLLTSFGALVLTRALLPVLSRTAVEASVEFGWRQARQWCWLLFASGAVGAVAIWVLSDWSVSLLFERGTFSGRDSSAVAELLRYGVLQLPFYFAGLAIVQWIAARGGYSSLLKIAFIALVTKVVMNLLLVPSLGLSGIMVATAGMYAASFGCQIFVAAKR
jgi:peptidoglycan biosynthesis protein MviN/MurJ (putative lipid II flippase)